METRTYIGPDGTRWVCAPEFWPALEKFSRDPDHAVGAVRVKRTAERAVYRLSTPAGAVYVKRYFPASPASRIKHLLLGTNAQKEWRAARLLACHGVKTPEPLAFGIRRGVWGAPEESWFVSREVAGAVSVERLIRGGAGLPENVWRQGALSLAVFVAGAHRAGLLHRDFHPGNLLLAAGEFYVADLHRVAFRKNPGPARRAANLAQLNMFFRYASPRTARHRFLRTYLEHSVLPGADVRLWARAVEAQSASLCEKFFRSRDRNIGKTGKFGKTRCAGARVFLSDRARREDVCRLASRLCAGEAVSSFRTKDGAQEWRVEKFSPRRGALPKLLETLVPGLSRGYRAWTRAHRLLTRNFCTPQPVAAVERPGAESYYVCLRLEGARTLARFLKVEWGALSVREKETFAAQLGFFLRKLFSCGIAHRDLSLENVLVRTVDTDRKRWEFNLLETSSLEFFSAGSTSSSASGSARFRDGLKRYPGLFPDAQ